MPKNKRDVHKIESSLIHGKFKSDKWDFQKHIVPPISSSTAFRLESAERGAQGFAEFANEQIDREKAKPIYIYERLDEPMKAMLEENLALCEGGETAVTFATGMAAISAVLGFAVKSGERIVAHRVVYGCTYSLLTNWYPRYNIETEFVDFTDPSNLDKAITPNTRLVYFETPSNPTLEIIDIEAVCNTVKQHNAKRAEEQRILTIIDNTFSSPFCQRPLRFGVDIVVHSLTKGLCGFGTETGGVIIAPKKYETKIMLYRKDFGGSLAAKSAWPFIVYGLPTLPIRMRNQIPSAFKVAQFLESHPMVESVRYPGLASHPQHEIAKKQMRDFDGNFAPGVLIYFKIKGPDKEAHDRGRRLMNWIAKESFCITLAVSLGWIKTLIEHPASMTHAAIPIKAQTKAGIDPGGIRMSIGLENPDDIIEDLKKGFEAVG